jgi:hypothetical protein
MDTLHNVRKHLRLALKELGRLDDRDIQALDYLEFHDQVTRLAELDHELAVHSHVRLRTFHTYQAALNRAQRNGHPTN